MKIPSKLPFYSKLLILLLCNYIPLHALIIKPEDIAVQTIWDSPKASKWQKFKIFCNDIKAKFPFNDAKSPHQAWVDFQPTCAKQGILQEERAICRIVNNQNRFGYGVIAGIPILLWLRALLVYHYRYRSHQVPYVPLLEIAVSPEIRAQLTYLNRKKEFFNPFEILNIGENSTKEDISRAYKKLSLQYHPDKHADEKELYTAIFKIIGQARESADYIVDVVGVEKSDERFGTKAKPWPAVRQKQLLTR